MNRAAWLQDRRMKKFRDILSRWELGELSMMEAGELLGMSERQFRQTTPSNRAAKRSVSYWGTALLLHGADRPFSASRMRGSSAAGPPRGPRTALLVPRLPRH